MLFHLPYLMGNFGIKQYTKIQDLEQGVPVYDPQLVAMRWPFLAAKAYSTAVGRA